MNFLYLSKKEIKIIGLLWNFNLKTGMYRVTEPYHLIIFNNPKSGVECWSKFDIFFCKIHTQGLKGGGVCIAS